MTASTRLMPCTLPIATFDLLCDFLSALRHLNLFSGARFECGCGKKGGGDSPFAAEWNRRPLELCNRNFVLIAELADLGFDDLLFVFKHNGIISNTISVGRPSFHFQKEWGDEQIKNREHSAPDFLKLPNYFFSVVFFTADLAAGFFSTVFFSADLAAGFFGSAFVFSSLAGFDSFSAFADFFSTSFFSTTGAAGSNYWRSLPASRALQDVSSIVPCVGPRCADEWRLSARRYPVR